ncbi:MAG: hypothetical protein Q9165_006008 [Trypethelium subeluteriae]
MKSRQHCYAQNLPGTIFVEESEENDMDRAEQDEKDLRTFFAVKLEQYSWDFMVPDVVRPLATISMRALVISVMRLGMRFQEFDLGKGVIRAEGNGQSIASYEVRGMGMVVRYHSNRRAGANSDDALFRPKMAPSEAADKLIFGIIPGCSKRRDLALVDDDDGMRLSERSLMTIGLHRTHRHRLFKTEIPGCPWGSNIIQMAISDLTALWSPYIPVLKAETARICHPTRLGPVVSPFLHWEGRKVLKHRLKTAKGSRVMHEVYDKLDFLENFFLYDFYTSWDDALMPEWDDNSRAPDRLGIAHFFSQFREKKEIWSNMTRGIDGIERIEVIENDALSFDLGSQDKEDYFVRGRARFLAILNDFWHWTETYFAKKKTILGTTFKADGGKESFLPQREDFFKDMVVRHTILSSSAVDLAAERQLKRGVKREEWASFHRGEANENSKHVKEFREWGWRNDKGVPKIDAYCWPYMVSTAHLYVDNLEEHLIHPIWQKYRRYKYADRRASVISDTGASVRTMRDPQGLEGLKISDEEREEIEEAWWVLTFRGTVWFMSIWMTLGHRPFSAALYESDTPVWIS